MNCFSFTPVELEAVDIAFESCLDFHVGIRFSNHKSRLFICATRKAFQNRGTELTPKQYLVAFLSLQHFLDLVYNSKTENLEIEGVDYEVVAEELYERMRPQFLDHLKDKLANMKL